MEKAYLTLAAFDRAIKKVARASGEDPGEAYRRALRDRFMCRVFYGDNESFVLKGGSSMLARIPGVRSTRDLDFATHGRVSAHAALEEMGYIAAIDLGDWCEFRLTKSEGSMDENGYSRLLKLRFATFVGREEKDPVLIDLSLDCSTMLPPERITLANRLTIGGIEVCDYLVYPLPDQLVDKLCAIMELRPGGYPSPRMKDSVDVITCATNSSFRSGQLRRAIESECAKRSMSAPESFKVPSIWEDRFEGLARKSGVTERFTSFKSASGLASRFFDHELSNKKARLDVWDDDALCWIAR